MVRKGSWKLHYDATGTGELYNLASDPSELNNLWSDPASTAEKMDLLESLLRWTIRTEDDLPQGKYTPNRYPHNWQTPPLAQ